MDAKRIRAEVAVSTETVDSDANQPFVFTVDPTVLLRESHTVDRLSKERAGESGARVPRIMWRRAVPDCGGLP
jgi:hypothetical protein